MAAWSGRRCTDDRHGPICGREMIWQRVYSLDSQCFTGERWVGPGSISVYRGRNCAGGCEKCAGGVRRRPQHQRRRQGDNPFVRNEILIDDARTPRDIARTLARRLQLTPLAAADFALTVATLARCENIAQCSARLNCARYLPRTCRVGAGLNYIISVRQGAARRLPRRQGAVGMRICRFEMHLREAHRVSGW